MIPLTDAMVEPALRDRAHDSDNPSQVEAKCIEKHRHYHVIDELCNRRNRQIPVEQNEDVSPNTYLLCASGGATSWGKAFSFTACEFEDVFFVSSVVLSTRVPVKT